MSKKEAEKLAREALKRLRTTLGATAGAGPTLTLQDSSTGAEGDSEPSPDRAFWSGVIGVEGELTGDGRFLEHGSLRWETPITLRYVQQDVGAHDGAVVVGRILSIERQDGGKIVASGDFDLGSAAGKEAYRQVSEELTNGVSMDLDDVSFEVRVAKELVDENDELLVALENGEEPERELAEDGSVIIAKIGPSDEVMATTDVRVRAATLVAIPAFATAKINITEASPELLAEAESEASVEALVASAVPTNPPADWFSNPGFNQVTPISISDDGQISGHLASWNVCHIGNPAGANVCVEAPHSATDYAYFHTGSVKAKDGSVISVGQITMNAHHAKLGANANSAAAHYDHTGTAVADVRVGEDSFGIWVAGALRPHVTAEQVRILRASPLSGDWRGIGGNMELVAALAVNVPGFPVPRPQGMVASGELNALVAAGMVAPEEITAQERADLSKLSDAFGELSEIDLAYLVKLAKNERQTEINRLADRVLTPRRRAKVAAFASGRS